MSISPAPLPGPPVAGDAAVARLDEARRLAGGGDTAAWMSASDLLERSAAQVLEVGAPLAVLFPQGGPRRGEVGAVVGSTSLVLAMLAHPSRQGRWCVVVGVTGLGLAAAREAGVALERLVLVPHPGERWDQITLSLLDAFDVVVLRAPSPIPAPVARRLAAVTRRQSSVLILSDPGGPQGLALHRDGDEARDVQGLRWRLRVVGQHWQGLHEGNGHLQVRRMEVDVATKGSRRTATVWLPDRPTMVAAPGGAG